jgi:electron transfer flavoprotein beta subunit
MVAVCVAPADLHPRVDELTGEVHFDGRRAVLPAAEATAVEYALQAASAWGGWVLAVSSGPASVDPVLSDLAALGVSVLRVSGAGDDPSSVASALSSAIRAHGEPTLVLCGDRSAVRGIGAVPAFLAHHLGLPHALGLVSLSLQPGGGAFGERRLDAGWRERLRIDGPAVVSVEGGSVRLRRASLAGLLQPEEVPVFAAAAPSSPVTLSPPRPYRPPTHVVPAPSGGNRERLLELTGALTNREPPRVIGPIDPAGAAEELLSYLTRIGMGPKGAT